MNPNSLKRIFFLYCQIIYYSPVRLEQNTITKQFIQQFNQLVNSGKIKSQKDLAEKLDYDRTALNNVIAGRRNLPFKVNTQFKNMFGISDLDTGDKEDFHKEKYIVLLESQVEQFNRFEAILKELTEIKRLLKK